MSRAITLLPKEEFNKYYNIDKLKLDTIAKIFNTSYGIVSANIEYQGNVQWIHKELQKVKMDLSEEKFKFWIYKLQQGYINKQIESQDYII